MLFVNEPGRRKGRSSQSGGSGPPRGLLSTGMKRIARTAHSGDVEIEVDGEAYRGHYSVTDGATPKIRVTASGPWLPGFRVAHVDGMAVVDHARTLLREIVTEAAVRQRVRDARRRGPGVA